MKWLRVANRSSISSKAWRLLAAVAIGILDGCAPSSPDLTVMQAARVISRTSEFSEHRMLVAVNATTRDKGSMDESYTARFVFRDSASSPEGRQTSASAEFRYWEGAWHLQNFSFGRPPDVDTIWVHSDVPRDQGANGVP